MRALTSTEIRLALREPVTLIVTLAFPLMLLVILLAVFGNQPDEAFGGVGGADFYVPAYAASVIAAAGLIALPVHLAGYKDSGVLRRLQASGLTGPTVLASQAAVMLATVGVGVVVMTGVGFAAYELSPPVDLPAALAGFLLGTATFAAVGVALAALLPNARAAQAVGLLSFFGMFFIAGGGPPRSILPEWMGTLGDLLPMTHLVRIVQGPWIGDGVDATAAAVLGSLLGLAVLASSRLRSEA